LNYGWYEAYTYALKRFRFLSEENVFLALGYVSYLLKTIGTTKLINLEAIKKDAIEIKKLIETINYNCFHTNIAYIADEDYGLKEDKPLLFKGLPIANKYINDLAKKYGYICKRTYSIKSNNFQGLSFCYEIYQKDTLLLRIYANCYYPANHFKDIFAYLIIKSDEVNIQNNESVIISKREKKTTIVLNPQLSLEENYGEAMLYFAGNKNKDKGFQILQELEDRGYYEASIPLGMYASSGKDEARLHFEKAANDGNSEGLWKYSMMLEEPFIPNYDSPNDVVWEESVYEASKGGCRIAMQCVAGMLDRAGRYIESFYWYKMCEFYGSQNAHELSLNEFHKWIDNGSPDIYVHYFDDFDEEKFLVTLSILQTMERGEPTEKDYNLIVKASENGNSFASHFLLELYNNDTSLQLKILPLLCELDDHLALRKYGDLYFNGNKEIEKDVDKAIEYYKKSAALGNRRAMYYLGDYYRDTNKYLSAYWYGMALVRGHQKALDALTTLLDEKN
jgi:TPR repeat protein